MPAQAERPSGLAGDSPLAWERPHQTLLSLPGPAVQAVQVEARVWQQMLPEQLNLTGQTRLKAAAGLCH